MPTMICFEAITEEDQQRIQQATPGWKIIHSKEKEGWLPHLPEAEILIGWKKEAGEVLQQPNSKLRWVQNWGAGVDKLPLNQFAKRKILLTNTSGVHAIPISETIIGMMLSFARGLNKARMNQAERKWDHKMPLTEIYGKTAGLIGVGAIGEETARVAKALGMNVIGVRRSGEPSLHVDEMYPLDRLDDLLAQSDFVINTLPLTDATHHLMGQAQFEKMRPSAIYINIGRGGTTNTEALLAALNNGTIAGAGLDVFEQEPLPESSPFWGMENVILTPHNAGSTEQYKRRALDIFISNLREYAEGKEPSRNRVDFNLQY